MPGITNALLAEKVNTLLTAWRNRELELQAWQSGTAVGGPYTNGTYPITDYVGTVGYYFSPAALVASVDSPKVLAIAAQVAAEAAEDGAVAAQAAAIAARDLALTYQTGAQAARDLALSYKNFAASHEANAQSYATAAGVSAAAAAIDAASINGDVAAADADATAAAASAAAAAASAIAAATFDPAAYLPLTAGASKPISGDLYTQGALWMQSAQPNLWMKETDAPADSGVWRLVASGGAFYGQVYNDAIGAGSTWLSILRSGITVSSIDLAATALTFNTNAVWHSGNPVTAANVLFNNAGQNHGDVTDFNSVTHFGPKYVQGTLNGPSLAGGTQYYTWSMGLGTNYAYSNYVCQFAMPRAPTGGNPVLFVRHREGGAWGSWSGIGAAFLEHYNAGVFSVTPTSTQWRVTTPSGYGDIGPANTGYFHFSTDRAAFYFGQEIQLGNGVRAYGANVLMNSSGYYLNSSSGYLLRETQGTYGVLSILGSRAGYSGIRFDDAYQSRTFMFQTGSATHGVYQEAVAAWDWYWNGTTFTTNNGSYTVPRCGFGASYPILTRGTAAPSGGADGDIYFQYT